MPIKPNIKMAAALRKKMWTAFICIEDDQSMDSTICLLNWMKIYNSKIIIPTVNSSNRKK